MAETVASTNQTVTSWSERVFREYMGSNRFSPYMGTNENAIIQINRELLNKPGVNIMYNLVGALNASAGPKDYSTTLEGNEQAMPNDGFAQTTVVVRDAVLVNDYEDKKSKIQLFREAQTQLMPLSQRFLRNDIVKALGSIDGKAYADATAGERNTWLTNNADRVLFGDALGNTAAGNHANSLANITAGMKMNKATISLAKRMAQKAVTVQGQGIRPYRYGRDSETFVMFVDIDTFRDIKLDLAAEHKDGMERGRGNPLFTPGSSLIWDDVVIREIKDMGSLGTVGAASAAVSPYYLCGAQALAYGISRQYRNTRNSQRDYESRKGVGFEEFRKIDKMQWGQSAGTPKDWGMVTGYIAAAPDA